MGENRGYYILFCSGVSVFYADIYNTEQGNWRTWSEINPDEWINTSNHDSCWRSDGLDFINKAYFEMCKNVNPEIAPRDLHSYLDFGFGGMWTDVIVTLEIDTSVDGSIGYWQKVVDVKPA